MLRAHDLGGQEARISVSDGVGESTYSVLEARELAEKILTSCGGSPPDQVVYVDVDEVAYAGRAAEACALGRVLQVLANQADPPAAPH